MRFRGKVDLWLWVVMIVGDILLLISLLSVPDSIACLIGFLIYNLAFLPFLIRNYVEVGDERVTVVFGFFRQSMLLSELTEVYRTSNPISSTAASLDRIILKGNHKSMMCAVKDRDAFFALLKKKNPAADIRTEKKLTGNSRLEKGTLIFCLLVAAVVAVLLFTGNISYEYGENSLRIKASYWADQEIPYDAVSHISYTDEKVEGTRVGGFGSFRLQMGNFKNKEYGNYKRYTYTHCDAAVILDTDETIFVISGESQEDTQALYRELSERCELP